MTTTKPWPVALWLRINVRTRNALCSLISSRRLKKQRLCSVVRGQHWYLYLILDIYSRKIVAWEIHETESGELARKLVERALLRECIFRPIMNTHSGRT